MTDNLNKASTPLSSDECSNDNNDSISDDSSSSIITNNNTNNNNETIISEDTIYEFYKEQLYPALISSLPILIKRIADDTKYCFITSIRQFITFVLPKWNTVVDSNNKSLSSSDIIPSSMIEFWNQYKLMMNHNSTGSHNTTIAHPSSIVEYMLRTFDSNHDGSISPNELTEIMQQWLQPFAAANDLLHRHHITTNIKETWSMWFTREWPLMEWKIGLMLYRTFGGILFVIALLSIIPGRAHGISARTLRWPVLGLTYFLVYVELMVYIVIRIFIRIAEYVVARPKHRKLRCQMSIAKSYEDWLYVAHELDRSQKRDKWLQQVDDYTSHRYNWGFIKELIRDMKKARSKKDTMFALAVIQQCTRKNVGGVMSEDLFSYSNSGQPKTIVNDFVNELCITLRWISKEASFLPIHIVEQHNNEHNFDNDIDDTRSHLHPESPFYDYKVSISQQQQLDEEKQKQDYQASNDFQEKVNEENNHLLHVLIHATLGLFMDKNNKDIKKTNDNNNDNDKDKKQGDCNKNNNDNGSNNSSDRVDICGNIISLRSSLSDISDYSGEDEDKNDKKNDRALHRNSNNTTKQTNMTPPNNKSKNFSKKKKDKQEEFLSAIHRREVSAFLKRARQAYGRTALCLSGGAMMGLYHFGHVLGLLESGVLPNIISGTSGGSVVGAIICTRTDEELKHDLNPTILIKYLKCFQRPWKERIKSFVTTGNLFCFDEWMDLIQWFTCGQMTFEEAYQKTGRIFCVTLSSTTKKAPPVLVNYLTAPNVTIASAVIASAAVPGFIPPVRLQYKDKQGIVRSQEGETYFDGSIEQDIPLNGLAEMLNCQFFIACQCNPHIVPFFYNSKGGVGRPSRWSSGTQEDSWRGGFLLAALEMYLKNDMKAKMRFLHDLEAAVGFTSTMLTQEFVGTTTIVPQVSFFDYFKLVSDPSLEDLYRYFQAGAVAAYEHTAMIKLHYSVADAIDECIQKLDIGEMVLSNQQDHPRSILFVPEVKKFPRETLSFSPLARRKVESPEVSREGKIDVVSYHTENDEDEIEREWVTRISQKK